MNNLSFILFFVPCFLFLFSKYSTATYTITPSEPIADGNSSSKLVSRDRRFELGFFSPGNSKNRYVGIWYKIDPASVVWVANRQNPVNDQSGILKIDQTGNLVIVARETVFWSSNITKKPQNPIGQLLDSGNLVIRDEKDADPRNMLWESFDYPTDTMLPDMKFGVDFRTGLNRKFTAWKNANDPSPGDLTYAVEEYHFPQMVMRKGPTKFFRDGPWNGIGRSGFAPIKDNSVSNVTFVYNHMELFARFNIINTVLIKIVMNQSNSAQESYASDAKFPTWNQYDRQPKDQCDSYGLCGPFGNCVINMGSICQCLKGFKPASPENWLVATWSQGCVRNNPICQKGDGFVKVSELKLPDTENTWVNKSMNIQECRAKCLQNCSCSAYTHLNISGKGSGCALWYGNLTDMRRSQFGQDLFIRMSASDLDETRRFNVEMAVTIAIPIVVALLMRKSSLLPSRRGSIAETGPNQ